MRAAARRSTSVAVWPTKDHHLFANQSPNGLSCNLFWGDLPRGGKSSKSNGWKVATPQQYAKIHIICRCSVGNDYRSLQVNSWKVQPAGEVGSEYPDDWRVFPRYRVYLRSPPSYTSSDFTRYTRHAPLGDAGQRAYSPSNERPK
jgi:hypothetical protein